MFGDGEWLPQRAAGQRDAWRRWIAQVRRPVVVELGAGSYVASVRDFSDDLAVRHGAGLVRINPREAEVPGSRDVGLWVGAQLGLEAVDAVLPAGSPRR